MNALPRLFGERLLCWSLTPASDGLESETERPATHPAGNVAQTNTSSRASAFKNEVIDIPRKKTTVGVHGIKSTLAFIVKNMHPRCIQVYTPLSLKLLKL